MTVWGRFLFSLLFLVACLTGVASVQPRCLERVGLDWLTGRAGAHLTAEQELAAKLEYRKEVLCRRLAAKTIVVGQLIDGQITLLEAAALFGYLNDVGDGCKDQFRDTFSGNSDGEKLCRQVIAWATEEVRSKDALLSSPEVLIDGLKAELNDLLAYDGIVHLPED